MSGRWSRACDEQSVGATHRSPARSAQLALTWITHALIAIEDGEDPSLHIARAGAYVRAWRKSLPDSQGLLAGHRVEWQGPAMERAALAKAGQWVFAALMGADIWLREIEAALRFAWKQATR